MAVRPRGGSWQVDVKINGQRIRETVATKTEALVMESEIRICLLKGETWVRSATSGKRTAATLRQVFDLTRRRRWKNTKAEGKTWLNAEKVMEFLGPDTPVADIDMPMIEDMVEAFENQGNANATINRKLAALSKCLTEALDSSMIKRKPKIARRKEGRGRVRYLADTEEQDLLAYFRWAGQPAMVDLCVVLVDTGMRVGEVLNSEARDLSAARDALSVWENKSDQPRTIPLTSRASKVLHDRAEARPIGKLFHDIKQRQVNNRWNKARLHMGLDEDPQFVPHALRHTFCSRLVQQGVSILTVKELAGHKVLEITMRYAHLAPQNLRSAIETLESTYPREPV